MMDVKQGPTHSVVHGTSTCYDGAKVLETKV